MKTIALVGKKGAGRVALVDDEDYDLVAPYRWHLSEYLQRGSRRLRGPYAVTYLRVDGRPTTTQMHTMITGWPLTDHRNHDGLDNQRANLRPATNTQNQQNRRSVLNSSSKYKGVHWEAARRRWKARITVNGKRRHLGYFADEEDAALAYNAAALEAFGPYAHLNEIVPPSGTEREQEPRPRAEAA